MLQPSLLRWRRGWLFASAHSSTSHGTSIGIRLRIRTNKQIGAGNIPDVRTVRHPARPELPIPLFVCITTMAVHWYFEHSLVTFSSSRMWLHPHVGFMGQKSLQWIEDY